MYENFQQLAKSKTSELYIARDLKTQQDVLHKIVKKEFYDFEKVKNLERIFQNKNPYIQKVKEILREPERTIFVMEYYNFGSLKSYLDFHQYFGEQESLFFFKQMLLGVKEYLECGIIHQNINFNNFIIGEDNIKLSQLAQTDRNELKAPETLKENILNEKSIVWTMGVLLYRMLYGDFPFKGNQTEIIDSIKSGNRNNQINQDGIFPILISKESSFMLDMIFQMDFEERPTITQLLSNSLIQNLKLEVKKQQNIKYSEKILENYVVYQNTKIKIDYDGYIQEDEFLAFDKKNKKIVKIKNLDYQTERVVEICLDNVKLYKKICQSYQNQNLQIIPVFQQENYKFQVQTVKGYSNQGILKDYIEKKKNLGKIKSFTDNIADQALQSLFKTVQKLNEEMQFHGSLHNKNLFLDNGQIKLGEPLVINDKAHKKMRDSQGKLDFFAPEFKQNAFILNPDSLLDRIDIWGFGVCFYYLIFAETPQFDLDKNPIIPFQNSLKIKKFIEKCLRIDPSERPSWKQLQMDEEVPFSFRNKQLKEIELSKNQEEIFVQENSIKKKVMRSQRLVKNSRQVNSQDSQRFSEISNNNNNNNNYNYNNSPSKQSNKSQFNPNDESNIILINDNNEEEDNKKDENQNYQIYKLRQDFVDTNEIKLLPLQANVTVFTRQRDKNGILIEQISLLTKNWDFYIQNDEDIGDLFAKNNCLNNFLDPVAHPQTELIDFLYSSSFILWILLGFLTFLLIVTVKSYQIVKLDFFTILYNSREQKLKTQNIKKLMILNYLEFAFFYHVHFQVFSFLYYANLSPCLSLEKTNGVQMMFDSTNYMIFGETGKFLRFVFFTFILFFVVHMSGTIFYLVHPLQNSQLFYNPFHIVFRLISYIVGVWIVTRIGAFLVYQPTLSFDQNGIIHAIFTQKGQAVGIFGFVPEIFEVILFLVDYGVEVFFQQFINSKKVQKQNNKQDKKQHKNIDRIKQKDEIINVKQLMRSKEVKN